MKKPKIEKPISQWHWLQILSFLLVPFVFGLLLLLHFKGGWNISWELLATVALFASPFLLVLVSLFFDEGGGFKFRNPLLIQGKQPIEGDAPPPLAPTVEPPLQTPNPGTPSPSPTPAPTPAPGAGSASVPYPQLHLSPTGAYSPNWLLGSGYLELSAAARKVLRTLLKFQLESFGEGETQAWGFVVPNQMKDHNEFLAGSQELRERQLVSFGERGLVFLTKIGLAFCRRERRIIAQALADGASIWEHFRS